jgi:hypothetical protein
LVPELIIAPLVLKTLNPPFYVHESEGKFFRILLQKPKTNKKNKKEIDNVNNDPQSGAAAGSEAAGPDHQH